MVPPNVSCPAVTVRVRPPRTTVPLPARLPTEAPAFVPAMSNVPLSMTRDEAAMLPLPVSARVAPGVRVVAPV